MSIQEILTFISHDMINKQPTLFFFVLFCFFHYSKKTEKMCLSVNSLSTILKNSTKINNNTNLVIAVDIRLNTSEADGCENIYDQAYTQIMP